MSAAPKTPPAPPANELERALADERDALKALFRLPDAARRQPEQAAKTPRRDRPLTVAIATLAVLGALYALDPAYHREHYETAVGEQRTLALADGSQITLAPVTRIDVSLHLRTRRVTLHDGRALFAVAAGYGPFDVAAGATAIRVVGTRFDVSRSGDDVTVAVAEGRVRVSGRQQPPALLHAADQVRSRAGKLGAVERVEPATVSAWSRGELVFTASPLPDALREIQRYRQAPIRLHGGEATARLEVSGVFATARSEQLLELLPTILPLRLSRASDGGIDLEPR
jgi:transmembrane sensor